MKNKIISTLLIFNLITTVGLINFLKKGPIIKEKEILKEMTESEQVSGLQTQIDTLNESHEEYARNIQSYKRQIASAITDMGIDTPENADALIMSSNIRSLTGASSADKVSYDNTNSGLRSTNVQGAVDELNESLGKDENSMTLHEKLDELLEQKNRNIELLGTFSGTSIDLSSYGDIQNVIPVIKVLAWKESVNCIGQSMNETLTYSFDHNTKILTILFTHNYGSRNITPTLDIYVY